MCADGLAKSAIKDTIKSISIRQENRDSFNMNLNGQTLEVVANFADTGTCGIQYPHQNDYGKYLVSNL